MTTPRDLLLELAEMQGIGPEVRELLKRARRRRPENLAQLLLRWRKRTGQTIYGVHQRCGLSRSQLCLYEQNRQTNPGIRTLQALSYGYRIPFSMLFAAALQTANEQTTQE